MPDDAAAAEKPTTLVETAAAPLRTSAPVAARIELDRSSKPKTERFRNVNWK